MRVLVLNGSVHGASGNSGLVLQRLQKLYKNIQWDVVHLNKTKYGKTLIGKLAKADGLFVISGTYWDSWGSPLQKFFEEATELEADPRLLGKPVAACVLMHSVGGKEVLSRLQGVLSTFGFLIPPMSGMAYSLSGQLSLKGSSKHAKDFWCLEDLEIVMANLIEAINHGTDWKSWPVDRKNFREKWLR